MLFYAETSDRTFTLTNDTQAQDFSGQTSGLTVIVNGDDDATEGDKFNVTLGSGGDKLVPDSYLRLDVNAGAGTDTLDLREVSLTLGAGNADVNLETGIANSKLAGTFVNFENVIAHQDGGRLVGTSGANTITLGEGDDDISAGGGDDTIVADGDTLTTNDDIDGGSGTDTLTIDGEDTLNIATAFDALTAVENIAITGTDDNDVTLTFATLFDSTSTSAISGGIRNVKIADVGGNNNVKATSAAGNDINLIGVTFSNVQTLTLDADTGTDIVRIDGNTLVGVDKLAGTATNDLTLSGGTYDLSSITISGLTEIDGSSSKSDKLIFGNSLGSVVDVDLGASTGDEVSFGTDVGDISDLTTFDGTETLSFGVASRVVIDDGHADNVGAIKGSASSSDVLVAEGATVDLTNTSITGVEKLVVDASGSAIALTVGASSFEAGTVVVGDSGTDEVILGASGVDVSKVTFQDFETLDFAARAASISIATLSGFSKIDGTANGVLTLSDSGALTLSSAAMTGAARIQGASGDDSWTFSSFSDGTNAVDIRLGSGNDTVTLGSGNTLATASFLLEDGNDVLNLGSNTLVTATGTAAGGAGTDTLKFSDTSTAATDLLAADFTGFERLAFSGASTAAVSLTLGANSIAVSTIDFSEDTSASGANTIDASAYKGSGYSIIGSVGDDTIKLGVATGSANGGAGNDTIEVTGVALATAAEAQTFTVSGGSSGTDVYDFKALAITKAVGQHTLIINDYSAGDDIDIDAWAAATTKGTIAGGELAQAVSQAIVDAAAPGSLAACFEALNDHADALDEGIVGIFQYNGNTYVYIDGKQDASYDSAEDFYITITGLHTIAAADLLT